MRYTARKKTVSDSTRILFLHLDMPRILFVSGFHPSSLARDLAFEFERSVSLAPLRSLSPNQQPSDMAL
jgi:hypothetical protein